MKYQLVLQWPASSISDYNSMVEVEDILIKTLTADSDVDGHDAGAGEMNIFIRTNDPNQTFNEIKTILGTRDFWVEARVAYREVTGNEYTILWPKSLTRFRVV